MLGDHGRQQRCHARHGLDVREEREQQGPASVGQNAIGGGAFAMVFATLEKPD